MSKWRPWALERPRMAIPFPELTYASEDDPWLKRATIRTIEYLSGRDYFAPLYDVWRREIVPSNGRVMRPVFDLIDVRLEVSGAWPPALEPGVPLVIVANHPYGFLDGFAALTLAEDLGRPFRVLINKDLMKVPEIRPYSLPVDFADTRAAQESNIKMRNEALRLLKEGTTIIVFPAGGVATSPTPFGRAVDLPWKTFTARMIQAARAQVLPVYFEGQCGPLFHAVSWISLTLRLSLIVAEFRRLVGTTFKARVGPLIRASELSGKSDRIALMTELYERVHGLSDTPLGEVRARTELLPAYLRGAR
jgi:putative hemolysin